MCTLDKTTGIGIASSKEMRTQCGYGLSSLQHCHGSTSAGRDIRECEGVRNSNLDFCMDAKGAPQARKLDDRDTDDNDITVSGDVANTKKRTSRMLDTMFNPRPFDANAGKVQQAVGFRLLLT